ncbi:hypothetical protein Ssi02_04020 [Sinosporangium siamense]|uniref:DUF3043 domain-containing protein n=1 Tax=Sinosporangium siamense TaxID=1367973 RepID=A0A919RA34_9ACTN|nr:hypothetical protein Ssi02_04020 [Sinosporangium siamense]
MTAPKTRKEAYRQLRERQASQRARVQEGLARGDERYYQPRDRGPVRKFARDWVDSRRIVSQYFLPFSLVILILTWVPFPVAMRQYIYFGVITVAWPVMMVSVLITAIWVGWRVKKVALEKFPGENMKGIGFYAAMRAMQIRRLRFPKPMVKVGGAPMPTPSSRR